MEEKNLEMMIERFFNAELSVEEEHELCCWLRENDVPAELLMDKEAVIALCGEPLGCELPDGAEGRLEAMLDELEEIKGNAVTDDEGVKRGNRKLLKIPRLVMNGMAAAAVVIVAYVVFVGKEDFNVTGLQPVVAEIVAEVPEEDTFDNPEDAMRCFMAACGDMELAMNTTRRNTTEIGNAIDESLAPYKEMVKMN